MLPFGNQTRRGRYDRRPDLGLLNQSATLFKGAIQVAGIRYKFYRYRMPCPVPQPYAWGAFDVEV